MSERYTNGECRLEPDGTTFRLTAAYTPTTHIHAPSSPEVWSSWLPVIGPTAYLAWLTLTSYLEGVNAGTELVVDLHALARSLGTSPSRLRQCLNRLAMFHLAHSLATDPAVLHVKTAAPPRVPREQHHETASELAS